MKDFYAQLLCNGRIGVIPTDTLYGLVGSAMSPDAVERIYSIKERNPKKPFIVLIADRNDLAQFGISLTPAEERRLSEFWSEGAPPTSVVVPITEIERFAYLHRGTGKIAFRLLAHHLFSLEKLLSNSRARLPDGQELESSFSVRDLCGFLKKTGPLVAPSANPEGQPPARTISEARAYFGDTIDFYIDGGRREGEPSRLVELLSDGTEVILRV
ncbi:MAG: tRNA threonylcarbamoyladenosine biosynthesis protein [Parcubacteria group bacterium Gr01-1014_72]|nr:MAG: tRNA threonylcarbamoyladenosine biosynthesis protein [Parcubacteria group bacterium Gr01-1014_72]